MNTHYRQLINGREKYAKYNKLFTICMENALKNENVFKIMLSKYHVG